MATLAVILFGVDAGAHSRLGEKLAEATGAPTSLGLVARADRVIGSLAVIAYRLAALRLPSPPTRATATRGSRVQELLQAAPQLSLFAFAFSVGFLSWASRSSDSPCGTGNCCARMSNASGTG